MHRHIDAVGIPAPDEIERMQIKRLGWD